MTDNIFKKLHFFKKNNKCFLFEGDSLRLFLLDELTYLKLFDAYQKDQFEELDESILMELKEAELISNKAEYETQLYESQKSRNPAALSNLTLCISNDCNLNCKYCFGDGGTYNKVRDLMDFETAKKSVDFLVSHSGERKRLTIVFFGGEPLLNFPVMKKIVEYCHTIEEQTDKKFRFNVSTNGTIIDDKIIETIKNNNIDITLSIDGPKEINDKYRCYVNGCGSFDKIQNNLKNILESQFKSIHARATICKPEPDVSKIENGLRTMGFNSVHMTPVDTNTESPLYMDDKAIKAAMEGYSNLAKEYIDGIKNNVKNRNKTFDDLLYTLYNKKLLLRSCNLGVTNIAINFKGDIYPCHRFMGDENYIIGTLTDGFFENKVEQFRAINVLNIEGCKDCWARFLCAGSCANSRVKHANLNEVFDGFCDLDKHLYELALYIYYELKTFKEDVFKSLFED